MTKKYHTYEIKFEEVDLQFVDRLYIDGQLVETDDPEMGIAEWEFRNDDVLYTPERAAEKAQGIGFSGKDYENLQTEGHGYGKDAKDIPAWR